MPRISDGRKSEKVAARKSLKRQIAGAQSIGASIRAAERGELMLDLIRMDGGTQSRQALDGETINDYAEAMKDGARFPAVTVFYDGAVYWLADGFHRVSAAKQAGLPSLPVELCQGTQRDAILFSVGANASHGKRRTNADKRQAVERLLRDEEWSQWSDRKIAEQCAVTHPYVAKIREELSGNNYQISTRFVQRNGASYPMNTGNIGKMPALQAPHGVRSEPPVIPALPKDIPVQLRDAVDNGTIARTQAVRMNNVMARLPEDVRRLALAVAGDSEDKVHVLMDLYKSRGSAGSNGTFDEIASSGGFHYGEELEQWCDFQTAGVLAVKDALKTLAKHHAGIEMDAKHAPAVVPDAVRALEKEQRQAYDRWLTCQIDELPDGVERPVLSDADIFSRFDAKIYSVWNFQGYTGEVSHFGNIPPEIIDNLLYYYTRPFDVVFDPFGGGGGTLDKCRERQRRCYISDLTPNPARRDIRQHDITTGLPEDMPVPDLIFLDPPYWKQAAGKYSDQPTDLANMPLDAFLNAIASIAQQAARLWTDNPNAHERTQTARLALIIGAWKDNGACIDLPFLCYQAVQAYLRPIQRIQVPYSTQVHGGAYVARAKEAKEILYLSRDLMIFGV